MKMKKKQKMSRSLRFSAPLKAQTHTDIVSSNYKKHTRESTPISAVAQAVLDKCDAVLPGDKNGATIRSYTENDLYADMNKALRLDDEDQLTAWGGYIFRLKDSIRQVGFSRGWFHGTAFRGMTVSGENLDDFRRLVQQPGKKILFATFLSASTSSSSAFNGNVWLELDCSRDPGVTYALEVKEWSTYPNENEVLFFPYSGFEVVSGRESEDGIVILQLRAYDREMIDHADWAEKMSAGSV